jgi:hypothetical protein
MGRRSPSADWWLLNRARLHHNSPSPLPQAKPGINAASPQIRAKYLRRITELRSLHRSARIDKRWMIERLELLRSELQPRTVVQRELTPNRQVHLLDWKTTQHVAPVRSDRQGIAVNRRPRPDATAE